METGTEPCDSVMAAFPNGVCILQTGHLNYLESNLQIVQNHSLTMFCLLVLLLLHRTTRPTEERQFDRTQFLPAIYKCDSVFLFLNQFSVNC